MKKVVKIKNMDCANCAAALERAIAKIDGITSVTVNFMSEKIVFEYDESKTGVFEEIKKVARKLEPDWEIIGL